MSKMVEILSEFAAVELIQFALACLVLVYMTGILKIISVDTMDMLFCFCLSEPVSEIRWDCVSVPLSCRSKPKQVHWLVFLLVCVFLQTL